MTSPYFNTPWVNSPFAYEVLESTSKDAWNLGGRLYDAWTQDAARLQQSTLLFFQRRIDKDISSLVDMARCSSPGELLDLGTRGWGEWLADYADVLQGNLCWFGDTLRHGVDETAKACGWPVPWLTDFSNISRQMS